MADEGEVTYKDAEAARGGSRLLIFLDLLGRLSLFGCTDSAAHLAYHPSRSLPLSPMRLPHPSHTSTVHRLWTLRQGNALRTWM